MTYRTASAASKAIALSIPVTLALTLTVGPHAFDQQPSTKLLVAPAQAAPGPVTAKAQRVAPGKTVQNGQQQVKLIFLPRTRYCAEGLTKKSSEIMAKKVCFTASDLWGRHIGTARLPFDLAIRGQFLQLESSRIGHNELPRVLDLSSSRARAAAYVSEPELDRSSPIFWQDFEAVT